MPFFSRKVKNGTYKNRLTGLLYCADCGAKLTYRSPSAQYRSDEKTYDSDNAFICGSYRGLHRDCTMHYIKVSVVEYTGSIIAPIIMHAIWNGVGSIILGGVSLAEDYPHLLNVTFNGNDIL